MAWSTAWFVATQVADHDPEELAKSILHGFRKWIDGDDAAEPAIAPKHVAALLP